LLLSSLKGFVNCYFFINVNIIGVDCEFTGRRRHILNVIASDNSAFLEYLCFTELVQSIFKYSPIQNSCPKKCTIQELRIEAHMELLATSLCAGVTNI